MKFFIIIFILFFFHYCSKPKTVLICGDHICINKKEAEQYFEENLSIEVKIIDNKIKGGIDLVELNLNNTSNLDKKISVSERAYTKKDIRVLNKSEIKNIKKKIKAKNNNKVDAKKFNVNKNISNKRKLKSFSLKGENKFNKTNSAIKYKNKKRKDIVDICTIIEVCSIDEISKYLSGKSKKKKFPDITTRE